MLIEDKKYTIMTDKVACLFCGIKKSKIPACAEEQKGIWAFFNIENFCEKRGEKVIQIL